MGPWRLGIIVPIASTIITVVLIVVIGELLLLSSAPENVHTDALFDIGHTHVRPAVLAALFLTVVVMGVAAIADRMGGSGE
jgi:hypothetical protein